MQLLLTLVAAAAIASTAPARADVIDTKFSGTVSSQVGTSLSVGAAVDGEFTYDTATGRYLSFKVAGQSVSPGYLSSADFTPDLYSAIYRAQLSPVQQGGTLNSTFAVDLEALTPWSAASPVLLLTDKPQLTGNLDPSLSLFSYYTANADGTHVKSLTASLGNIVVSVVPEPTTGVLFGLGAAALGLFRARRRA